MKIRQREAWNSSCDLVKLMQEYDAAIDAGVADARLKVVRRLPEVDRMIMYATADGASSAMIGSKLNLSTSAVSRRVRKLKRYVRIVCDMRDRNLRDRG